MSKIKISLFLFSFSIINILNSQIISGIIKSEKGLNIPYASISYKINKNENAIADSLGIFYIKKVPKDSLQINSIGYKPYIISTEQITSNPINIFLEENIDTLSSIIIVNKKKLSQLSDIGYSSKRRFVYSSASNFFSIYIHNPTKIEGLIKSVNFRIKDGSDVEGVLRIRFFVPNPNTGEPDKEIVYQNNIMPIKELSKNTKFKIEDNQIPFTKAGIFVYFEFLENDKITRKQYGLPGLYVHKVEESNHYWVNMNNIWIKTLAYDNIADIAYFFQHNISLTIAH